MFGSLSQNSSEFWMNLNSSRPRVLERENEEQKEAGWGKIGR